MLKWAKFFHAQTREEFETMAKENEYLEKAYERLVNLSEDEKKRREYQAREDAIRDYNWQMKTNFRRGVREGMERGVMQGLQILIETLKDMGQTEEEVCQKIMERYDLKLEEAQNYIKMFWKKD